MLSYLFLGLQIDSYVYGRQLEESFFQDARNVDHVRRELGLAVLTHRLHPLLPASLFAGDCCVDESAPAAATTAPTWPGPVTLAAADSGAIITSGCCFICGESAASMGRTTSEHRVYSDTCRQLYLRDYRLGVSSELLAVATSPPASPSAYSTGQYYVYAHRLRDDVPGESRMLAAQNALRISVVRGQTTLQQFPEPTTQRQRSRNTRAAATLAEIIGQESAAPALIAALRPQRPLP